MKRKKFMYHMIDSKGKEWEGTTYGHDIKSTTKGTIEVKDFWKGTVAIINKDCLISIHEA